MPLVAMNREIGSLGRDVARGVADHFGIKTKHHEMIDALANRARVRKSHVLSFLDGRQGLWERLTSDQLSLGLLTADEIMVQAEKEEGVVLRGWGATSLLKEVPHAVRVCVTASRSLRIKRTMERLNSSDESEVGRIVDQNDEAGDVIMRRHFHIDSREVDEYDLCLNTDRMPVAQCTDIVIGMVKSAQFAETETSRARLRDVALGHHVRAALRVSPKTKSCKVHVSVRGARATLDGVVDSEEQRQSCIEVASGVAGIAGVESKLRSMDTSRALRR
jgi:cytidylate kinase